MSASEKSQDSAGGGAPTTNDKYREIVMLLTGPMVGVSGGDTHALRFVAAYENHWPGSTSLVTPESVVNDLPESLRGSILDLKTPLQGQIRNIYIYAIVITMRTILAMFRMPKAGVAVASSHFFNDVIPCVVARWRGGSGIATFIYHIVADMDRPRSIRTVVSKVLEYGSLALLKRYADIIFVDNVEVVRSLEKRGFTMDKIVMTANAFDPLVPLPPRVKSDPPAVAFLGRFVEEKGIWDILELGKSLATSTPEAKIEMIGDGPLHEKFSQELSASGLTNITLHGFVSETEKWDLLRRANLFVAPSREEGWGIAVGEALTAGVPVVAYDLPAYRYLGDAIDRVPIGQTDRFVREVAALVGNPAELDALSSGLATTDTGLPLWDDILSAEFEIVQQRLLKR